MSSSSTVKVYKLAPFRSASAFTMCGHCLAMIMIVKACLATISLGNEDAANSGLLNMSASAEFEILDAESVAIKVTLVNNGSGEVLLDDAPETSFHFLAKDGEEILDISGVLAQEMQIEKRYVLLKPNSLGIKAKRLEHDQFFTFRRKYKVPEAKKLAGLRLAGTISCRQLSFTKVSGRVTANDFELMVK